MDVTYLDYARRNERTVVFRLYEALGGRGEAVIAAEFPVKAAGKTNIMEDELER